MHKHKRKIKTHTCVQTRCTEILSTPGHLLRIKQQSTMQHQSNMTRSCEPAASLSTITSNLKARTTGYGSRGYWWSTYSNRVWIRKILYGRKSGEEGILSSRSHDNAACIYYRSFPCRFYTRIEKMITNSNLKSKAARWRAMQAARDGAV